MKNLWKIITGTVNASAEDLARATVEIERKIVTFQSELESAEAEALQLNKKNLCGETIKDEDMDLAERKVLTAKRNLNAGRETLEELKIKLNEAAAAKINTELAANEQKRQDFYQRQKKATLEHIKAQARLDSLALVIHGPQGNYSRSHKLRIIQLTVFLCWPQMTLTQAR